MNSVNHITSAVGILLSPRAVTREIMSRKFTASLYGADVTETLPLVLFKWWFGDVYENS